MSTGLKTFPGGTHPPEKKELSRDCAIETAPLPQKLYIPLTQHIGAPCKPAVSKGDAVKKGQVVGQAAGFVSAPVHASVSGTVASVEKMPGIFGSKVDVVVIENDGLETWLEGCNQPQDYSALSPDELRNKILAGGLVGMGGATFPTHVKLSPPAEKPINTLVINGCECEPYLTADERLMLEQPERIVKGAQILLKAVGAKRGIVAVEANKREAFEKMREAFAGLNGWSAELLAVKYPQGAEKQLIKALLRREVPSGGLPMDVGALVSNVGTAAAVCDAVTMNKPLIERVTTVTGEGVDRSANFLARIGTPVGFLLDLVGLKPEAKKIVLGGPMMGLAQFSPELPVTKGTSGILVLNEAQSGEYENCIRCGRCVEGCPSYLVPSTLGILCKAEEFDLANENNLLDCIECGVCTYVCPAKIPLVHLLKLGKAEVARRKKMQTAK
jgi:electron transport complex protein RnfC